MEWNITTLIGIGLMVLGVIGALGMAAAKLLPSIPRPATPTLPAATGDPVLRNSDAPPPVGIKDYVALIKEAAPFADAEILWAYAGEGYTEAQVLRAEVVRLGKTTKEA